MGGKKFEISRLVNIRKQVVNALKDNKFYNAPDDTKFSCQVCVDWNEFNKLYFSKRNSVIQSLGYANKCDSGYNTISLYAAMKMAFDLKQVHIVTNYNHFSFRFNEFYNAIVPSKNITGCKGRLNLFPYHTTHSSFDTICNCDEIVMIPDAFSSVSHGTLNFIDAILNELAKPRFRDVKLTILTHDIKEKHGDSEVLYKGLKERFPDFLYFDYTKEKEFVDNWFDGNDTLIDPEFDIKVLDPALDKKKVWRYLATNHKYKFREYCKLDREFVIKDMPMKELKDYGIF